MQAIMETIFEIIYLLFALCSGLFIMFKSKGRPNEDDFKRLDAFLEEVVK